MTALRSAGAIGPSCDAGGRISVRCAMPGTPFSSRNEVTASPVPTSRIASSMSKSGFRR